MRGIASFYRKGTVFYQVSLCIQSLCMTARKVRELDRAVDILLMLMSIKQKMGGIVDPSLFVQKMTDAVPAAFEEYGVTAEEMGLRFQVMMCMRFWVRPPLHTPQQAKLEDALQAWSRLTRFRSPLGQGARGFARMDLKELEERWRAFREVYLDILTEGGPSDQSRRFNASRRLDALAEVEWARCSTAAELFRVDLQCLLEDSGARWHAAAQSLGEAARKGDLNVMMAKLLDGGDPNERDHLHPKYTPLHRAASGGHRHAVRLLLKAKADVLMRDRLGFSALHFAANQSVGLVSDLVEAKCDVNAANLQQMTPLHSAAGMGRVDI
ncbi:Ankyrin-2 (ANK-2) (Ankyrin-B) (Brain ankyrin), partial [Durusdinium trenchii]